MRCVIIDYGAGNLRSAAQALRRVAPDGMAVDISAEAEALAQASHIVLPGVGAFRDCMAGLTARPGMIEAMEREVRGRGKPFLGICVGMQLLAERGHEHGVTSGLGWIAGEVVPIPPGGGLKIPHMGWNTLSLTAEHPLLAGIAPQDHAYFVHSYHLQAGAGETLATVDYGQPLAAAVAKGNIAGTQFHPEKSQKTGLTLLRNFLRWKP